VPEKTENTQKYTGYCVKCKEKRDFEGHVEVSKTGMRMAKGKCPVCGTTVNRILGKA
jgi:rRNA maturation endonuclease Nob1